jgi:hypothetical protein
MLLNLHEAQWAFGEAARRESEGLPVGKELRQAMRRVKADQRRIHRLRDGQECDARGYRLSKPESTNEK